LKFCERVGKLVRRGGQAEFFGGQPADAFAVHGEPGGAGGGDDFGEPGGLDLDQHVGGDGLDFRHDQLRFFQLDQRRSAAPSVMEMTWARWAT
jgi:hypothetical protein